MQFFYIIHIIGLHCVPTIRSSSFGISGRKCKRKCNMHWFLNTHPILMHLAYLLLCCFNFWFLLNILCDWSSVFCMFDMALNRPSSTMQLTSGVDVFAHVCGQKVDTSSNCCDNIQPYDKRLSVFVKCDTIFRLFFKCHKFELLTFVR